MKNEFIYTIKTSIERDRIEQVSSKKFDQNASLDKVNRENTFWLLQEKNIYRSVNWVYCYYTSFDHSLSLDDQTLHYYQQLGRFRGFKQEKLKERKLAYTTYECFKTLKPEEKKLWLWSQKVTS